MYAQKVEQEGYISPEEVALARARCKLGDVVEVQTYKTIRVGVTRVGVVVGKYSHFATVWLPGGIMDSVSWVEMARRARRR